MSESSDPTSRPNGVSVVIPAHNAAARLPQTLERLTRQTGHEQIAWEVIVIDNASTDSTADVAKRFADRLPLRVISEPRPGSTFARERGRAEAKYDIISLLDDDNNVPPDWIARAYAVMSDHPDVGVCATRSVGVFEMPPPPWFAGIQAFWAVGPQGRQSGDITNATAGVWTAGMIIRAAAWRDLVNAGFQSALPGRVGKSLACGEDNELTIAFRIAGWRIWYEDSLSFEHVMPAGRLTWDYARRLNRGLGVSGIVLELYGESRSRGRLATALRRHWLGRAIVAATYIPRKPITFLRTFFSRAEGHMDVLWAESCLGAIQSLCTMRSGFTSRIQQVANNLTQLRDAASKRRRA